MGKPQKILPTHSRRVFADDGETDTAGPSGTCRHFDSAFAARGERADLNPAQDEHASCNKPVELSAVGVPGWVLDEYPYQCAGVDGYSPNFTSLLSLPRIAELGLRLFDAGSAGWLSIGARNHTHFAEKNSNVDIFC